MSCGCFGCFYIIFSYIQGRSKANWKLKHDIEPSRHMTSGTGSDVCELTNQSRAVQYSDEPEHGHNVSPLNVPHPVFYLTSS